MINNPKHIPGIMSPIPLVDHGVDLEGILEELEEQKQHEVLDNESPNIRHRKHNLSER